MSISSFFFFFFNDTATTEIYTLSLHDALPISFEEALVGLRHMLERIAVYDDDRRVHAALVRIAHLGAVDARLLGRLELYGLHQQAREHRRGHLAGGSLVRLDDGVPQRTQALALFRRDEMHGGELEEGQARLDRALQHLALVVVH